MEKMTCPVCGKSYDKEVMSFLDNGNPACSMCVEEEEKRKKSDGISLINDSNTKRFCAYCKTEISSEQEFCSACGEKYFPLICDNCKKPVSTSTNYCMSCGKRVKSLKEKKKSKIIKIVSIASAAALILSLCLVLFIPYQKIEYCSSCNGGRIECFAKIYAEELSGKKIYNHDCGLCENGYNKCIACNGDYWNWVTTNNFREWF